MQKFKIKQQIKRLYMVTAVGYFQIAGASWVALLALRGFSLLEIGVIESIFHVVSMCFEIPSGVVADVFGRKKTLLASLVFSLISSMLMILSNGFGTIALAISFSAVSYNLASGTREALAYDSLKAAGQEDRYNRYASTEMMLYRITNSTATLCAGLALWLGCRRAYAVDMVFGLAAVGIASGLTEVEQETIEKNDNTMIAQTKNVITESWHFLQQNRRARIIIILNALVGSISTLLLFFLQAKLPQAGLSNAMLGPILFVMGLGAALGAKVTSLFPDSKFKNIFPVSAGAVCIAFALSFTGQYYVMAAGGFIGAFADDFLEVRADVILNEMIPSEQRATLVSVSSFVFSVVMIGLATLLGWVMG
jgi:MFS family permease